MSRIRNLRRPKFTTVLAALALFAVLGGTATAASGLINGKKIKKGTVTAKQLKNKTLTTAKFSPATIQALQGAQGPRGEKGAKGETGAPGPKGDPGPAGLPGPEVINTYSTGGTVNNVPANDEVQVAAFNGLDAGRYLVIAKAIMFGNTGGALLRCDVSANNGGGGDEAQWSSPGNSTRSTVPMVFTTSTANVTNITADCDPGATLGSFTVDMVAIPVG